MSFLLRLFTSIKWLFGHDLIGVVLQPDRVFVYNYPARRSVRCSITQLTTSTSTSLQQMSSAIRFAARQFRRGRKLVVIFSSHHNTRPLTDKAMTRALERIHHETYVIDYRMCLILGAGIEADAMVKRICVFIFEDSLQIFTLFTGHTFDEVSIPFASVTQTSPLLETRIAQLLNAPSTPLPTVFHRRSLLTPEEQQRIPEGWMAAYTEPIYIFPLIELPFMLPPRFGDCSVVVNTAIDDYAEQGMQRFVDELSNPDLLYILRHGSYLQN